VSYPIGQGKAEIQEDVVDLDLASEKKNWGGGKKKIKKKKKTGKKVSYKLWPKMDEFGPRRDLWNNLILKIRRNRTSLT